MERPNIIKCPYLMTMDYRWKEYTTLWGNFIDDYNCDKESREQLKAGHMQVYYRLVKEAQKKMRNEAKAVNSDPKLCAINPNIPYIVTRSKHVLAKINGVSPDTAKRYLQRLEEAGVISTNNGDFLKYYGRKKRRGEVLIMPDFLLIYDKFDLNYEPVSKFLKTEKCGFQPEKDANCPGVSSISPLQDSNNKTIGCVRNVEKGIGSADGLKNTGGRPGQEAKPSKSQVPVNGQQNSENTKKTSSCSPESNKKQETRLQEQRSSARPLKIVDKFAEKRKEYAKQFYTLLLKFLFFETRLSEQLAKEENQTLQYIEDFWFMDANSNEKAEKYMQEYRERIALVVGYCKRTKYNFKYNTPLHYLNTENPKGFVATKKWLEETIETRARRREKRLQMVVDQAVMEYEETPDLSTFNKWNKHLKANAPELLRRFYQETNTLNL